MPRYKASRVRTNRIGSDSEPKARINGPTARKPRRFAPLRFWLLIAHLRLRADDLSGFHKAMAEVERMVIAPSAKRKRTRPREGKRRSDRS